MNLIDCLSKQSKKDWPEIYKKITGKKWIIPEKDKRGIQCETKTEDVEEIGKIMRQVPNPTERR